MRRLEEVPVTDAYGRATGPEERTNAPDWAVRPEDQTTGERIRAAGGEVAGTAGEQARQVTAEAGDQARRVLSQARERLSRESRDQTRRLARGLHQLADELQQMADRSESGSPAQEVVRQAAERGHQAARYLEEQGLDGMVTTVQDFARRRPGVFLAGAALAGFVVGRIARSLTGDAVPAAQPEPAGSGTSDTTPEAAAEPEVPAQAPPPESTVPRTPHGPGVPLHGSSSTRTLGAPGTGWPNDPSQYRGEGT